MANTKFTDLLPDILSILPADPSNPLTLNTVLRTIQDFCTSSMVWRDISDPIDVVQGTNTYDLDVPQGAMLVSVMSVNYDAKPLRASTVLDLYNSVREWETRAGRPCYYTQLNPEEIILAPVPDESLPYGLSIITALQPSMTATFYPRWIHNRFQPVIVDGVLGQLMQMPGKRWTDMKNGALHQRAYENGRATARAVGATALGSAPIRTTTYM